MVGMSVASFPIMGPVNNPTLDDYRVELAMQEADLRQWFGTSAYYPRWVTRREWRKLVFRMEWQAGINRRNAA